MKTIGIIGGMSWESSAEYYRIINQIVNQRLGGVHSARIVMYSVDFGEIERLQHVNDWTALTMMMIDAAGRLERAGADLVLIATNTMHKMAEEVASSIAIPLLHIADTAGAEIKRMGLNRVGLLGTKFTMEQDFYRGRLQQQFGLEVLVPNESDRNVVHQVIYQELVLGAFREESRAAFRKVIAGLAAQGAQGIILGCTEIPLLIQAGDSSVPLFDTTRIHAEAAVGMALTGVVPFLAKE
jgi:aspartate racemase